MTPEYVHPFEFCDVGHFAPEVVDAPKSDPDADGKPADGQAKPNPHQKHGCGS